MADRTLVVRLKAELGRFQAEMAGAAKSVKGVGDAADAAQKRTATSASGFARLSSSIRENRSEWDRLSTGAMVGGAAIVGGLGLAAKAAIDWESAWAGVNKTVDGTPEQMAELETGLRNLAKTLPATHEEIAGVAEAAGQLGVARGDILKFTETAIALGESTNLTAEEAATSLAKFSNVMGTVSREGVAGYEKLGSTLVALGNAGASTEADIMAMALRLAGAGKQIGATEADILAMSNALASVGIEAELGGGAMSRAMLKMNSAVISGGDELAMFAEVAGVSASKFATAWREDPIQATNMFVTGLGKIGESGGDASQALAAVGLSGTQNAQVLLRAAGASDMLSESLDLGASAWAANSALAEEAGKRYETDASKIQVAVNQVKDAMITVGADVAPIVASVAGGIAKIADSFGSLPDPVRKTITALSGVAGAGLLLGGATIKAVGFAQDMADALNKIGPAGTTADGGLTRANRSARGVAKWGGYALGVLALASAIGALSESTRDAPASIEQMTAAILDLDAAGNSVEIDKIFGDIDMSTSGVDDLTSAFQRLTDPKFFEKTSGMIQSFGSLFGMSTDADRLKESFETLGASLASMPADEAAAKFDLMVEAIGGGEENAKKLLELMPAYRDSLTGAANDAKLAGDGASEMGGDLEGMGDEAADAGQAVDDLSKAIKGLGDLLLNQRGSARDYQASLDDVAKSLADNGKTLDINTEAGRANEAALDDLANSTQEWAASVFESTGNVDKAQAILDQGRTKWIDYATAMGLSEPKAKALADVLFEIPMDVAPEISVPGAEAATQKTRDFQGLITGLDGTDAKVTVKEEGANPSMGRVVALKDSIFGLKGKDVSVTESGATPAKGRVMGLNDKIIGLNGKTVTVKEEGANPSKNRVAVLDGAIFGLQGKRVTVTEIGSTAAGGRVVSLKGKIYEIPQNRTSNVQANVHGLWDVQGLNNSINNVQSKTVTITAISRKIGALFADGGMLEGGVQTFADGGFASIGAQQPQIRPAGGAGITWAEEGAGPWEGFVSGHPRKKPRSRAITSDIVDRLGGRVEWYADGGVRSMSPHEGRTYVAPQPSYQRQSPSMSGGNGATVAYLHPEHVALLRRVADRPVRLDVDGRTLGMTLQRNAAKRKGR